MKEAYEQAVAESGRGPVKQRDVEVKSDKARTIKERFERGEVAVGDNSDEDQDSKNNKTTVKDEDFNVFEAGTYYMPNQSRYNDTIRCDIVIARL